MDCAKDPLPVRYKPFAVGSLYDHRIDSSCLQYESATEGAAFPAAQTSSASPDPTPVKAARIAKPLPNKGPDLTA